MPETEAIRSIGVVGGGSAGYLAALTLRAHLPDTEISLLESSSIPVIGVGEATTSEFPPFLYKVLGFDIEDFYRKVRPTYKLGIRFNWGGTDEDHYFNYPFDTGTVAESQEYDGHIRRSTLESVLMSEHRHLVVRSGSQPPFSLEALYPFGYHIDNKRFLAYLRETALARDITHVDCTITDVEQGPDGLVTSVVDTEGRRHRFDFFIDCTGFKSLLLEKTMGSPFLSYGSSLLTDSALFGTAAHDGTIKPYTRAQTMDNGWAWTIPMREEDHLGYVYSSAFVSDEDAEAEFRRVYPGLGPVRKVRFRSGRHDQFVKGNVAAIGNSYGFVEPLESTGLFVICRQSLLLSMALAESAGRLTPKTTDAVNGAIADTWDFIRGFLSIHYRFNTRRDTEFWRACRSRTDISAVEHLVARFGELGALTYSTSDLSVGGTVNFGAFGHDVLLFGQQVPHAATGARETREAYERRAAGYDQLAKDALPQTDALRFLEEHPEILREPSVSESSWMAKFIGSVIDICEEALRTGHSKDTTMAERNQQS
ncbi:tryptophan halogenase family protein [Streptomyces sp. NBC_00557]|uniref:tryptophan halogenase family protein n=1 Tax=Streptomyces sp. NBC_00557 TaxID=2975776 RepID=UPI002E813AEB|nr:tryptophan halogenase family protein [Streptomyces sp. NBC_00557]WUC40334.1 tryptophan 7-halogenase [Streptomyces sp. NBC_00557]